MKKPIITSLCLVSVSVYAQTGGLRSEVGVPPPTVRAETPRETVPSISNLVKPSMPAMNNEPALTSSEVQANTNLNGGGQESGDKWLDPKSMTSSAYASRDQSIGGSQEKKTSPVRRNPDQPPETSNIDVPVVLTNAMRTNRAYEDSSTRTKAQQVGSNPLLVMPPSPLTGNDAVVSSKGMSPSETVSTQSIPQIKTQVKNHAKEDAKLRKEQRVSDLLGKVFHPINNAEKLKWQAEEGVDGPQANHQ